MSDLQAFLFLSIDQNMPFMTFRAKSILMTK